MASFSWCKVDIVDIVQHFGWKRFEMNWDDCLAQGQQSFSLRVLWLGALLAPCLGAMWNWTQIKLPFQVICLSNLIFCEGSDKWTWPCHKLKWSQLMSRDQMHEKNHAHNESISINTSKLKHKMHLMWKRLKAEMPGMLNGAFWKLCQCEKCLPIWKMSYCTSSRNKY